MYVIEYWYWNRGLRGDWLVYNGMFSRKADAVIKATELKALGAGDCKVEKYKFQNSW